MCCVSWYWLAEGCTFSLTDSYVNIFWSNSQMVHLHIKVQILIFFFCIDTCSFQPPFGSPVCITFCMRNPVFDFSPSHFLDLECLSVLRCQFVLVFLSDGVKQRGSSVIITVWHSCAVCNVVDWSWSFRSVCMSKPVLVVVVCLLSWQIMVAFGSAELTSLHDITLP